MTNRLFKVFFAVFILLFLGFWFLQLGIIDSEGEREFLAVPTPSILPSPYQSIGSATAGLLPRQRAPSPTAAPGISSPSISFILVVGENSYLATISQGKSVYEAMETLASNSPFTFNAKYYSSLGYFIQEIDGIENDNGAYWTLYVNQKYSPAGASQYFPKEGDIIEWKYE